MGFNSESGLAVGTALQGFTIVEDPNASGQEVSASIHIVNSHEELMENMGMSFEAQGRYGFFSASAKAQFSESSNFNSTSTFLIARCLVENPLRRGTGFQVTEAAQDLLDSLRFDDFRTAFGDSFVRGLQTGGEFYAVIRITSVTSSTQSELALTLQAEANGLVAGGEFEAAFSKANASSSTQSEFTATMYQKAGSGAQISPTVEISEVKTRFKNFPEIASSSAAAYEAEVATYDTLPLPVPTPEEQEAFLLALADARETKLRYIQTRNDLQFAIRNPSFFQDLPSPATLNEASAVYTKLINAVTGHAIMLSRGQITPPRLFDSSELTPPIVEPEPILLERVSPAAVPEAPLMRVPNMIGQEIGEIESAMMNAGSGIEEIITGNQFFFPSLLPRDVIEFAVHAQVSGSGIAMEPAPGAFDDERRAKVVSAQFPAPGALVPNDTLVTLQWVKSD
jgi:hypothetical protein